MVGSITSKPAINLISRDRFDAVLFDMDGVVTKTATLHCAAWKLILDALLESRFNQSQACFTESDYLKYGDGRPREDGVEAFLTARDLVLPEGQKDDPPGLDTVNAAAHLKDATQGLAAMDVSRLNPAPDRNECFTFWSLCLLV